ncbi:MAG: carbohydrate ABC transporter permease [Trueperaceae bacterium]
MTRLARFVSTGAMQIVLMAIALFWLLPVFVLFIQSLRSSGEIANSGWWTALANPSSLMVDNYRALLENPDIIRSFWNTVYITVPTTILVVAIAAGAAYALSWIKFRGRDTLLLIVVGLLVVPLQIALIPLARLFGDLGLFGTIPGVVLFHVGFGLPFAIFLLRNFFVGVPRELFESARVDGANDLIIFARILIPLALPAIASLTIFQFLWVWNDLLIAMVFADPASAPLTAAIQRQTRAFGQNVDVIAPGAFLQMVVPLFVFFAFQRYFVQGILGGAVKG